MILFNNEVLFSKNKIKKSYNHFVEFSDIEGLCGMLSSNVPRLVSTDVVMLGWAWNCVTGAVINEADLLGISLGNYPEKISNLSGRFIILCGNKHLFTDATSTYPIYFTNSGFATNLSLLCEVNSIEQKIDDCFRKKIILPPTTGVEGIKRLIPGQYLDLHTMEAKTFKGFIKKSDISSIEKQAEKVTSHLKGSANGIQKLTSGNFRLFLTAGSDSRLSFLALYSQLNSQFKTTTHSKPYFLNDPDDISIPKKLTKALGIDHQITKKTDVNNGLEHAKRQNVALSLEKAPGSTIYYYKNGNWQQIKEEYLIDNYYEVGRMHWHGKGILGSPNSLSLQELMRNGGYYIEADDFVALKEHISQMTNHDDVIDVFYFIQNYINVANQFELLNFSHTPLIFCNSLKMFELMLSVPDSYRAKGVFHQMLIDKLNVTQVLDIDCNPNKYKLSRRVANKLRSKLSQLLLRTKG